MEGDVGALADGGGTIVLFLGAGQAAVDALDHLFHGKARMDMELRGVAHLDVAHVFGHAVDREFIGDALEVFGGLENGAGEAEALQVIRQVAVLLLEDQLLQAGFRFGGQGYFGGPGQFDQRGEPQGAVEVEVQVGLGQRPDEFGGKHGPGFSGKGANPATSGGSHA